VPTRLASAILPTPLRPASFAAASAVAVMVVSPNRL
jgi:hypothetical protein